MATLENVFEANKSDEVPPQSQSKLKSTLCCEVLSRFARRIKSIGKDGMIDAVFTKKNFDLQFPFLSALKDGPTLPDFCISQSDPCLGFRVCLDDTTNMDGVGRRCKRRSG
jgi:hypothetical protein